MVTYTYLFVACVVCTILGVLAGIILSRSRADGVFKVDVRDPNKDTYSLEFRTPLDDIPHRKSIHFDVEVIE